MNHPVYVVMVNDRHVDPEPEVFASRSDALEYAETYVRTCARRPEDAHIVTPPSGWLFLGYYSVEADCVWVLERTLR